MWVKVRKIRKLGPKSLQLFDVSLVDLVLVNAFIEFGSFPFNQNIVGEGLF
jgi:hypothetical protein